MIYTHFEVKYHPRTGFSTDIKTKQKYRQKLGAFRDVNKSFLRLACVNQLRRRVELEVC